MQGQKEYEAVLQLGVETDTHDLEGTVVATGPV
jgi:tRNA U55 pseudouridine synthase TruB